MIIHSPIGDIRVFVDSSSVVEVLLPGWRSDITPTSNQETPYARKVEVAFYNYFDAQGRKQAKKEHKELVDVCLPNGEVQDVSPFHRLIYKALTNDVPTGTVLSYGDLAGLVDNPKASRAVGTAMRKNPVPIIVPCHRVIQSNGKIGGYMGSGEDGLTMKRWLLSHEGAKF